jgi:hypothetical protein
MIRESYGSPHCQEMVTVCLHIRQTYSRLPPQTRVRKWWGPLSVQKSGRGRFDKVRFRNERSTIVIINAMRAQVGVSGWERGNT